VGCCTDYLGSLELYAVAVVGDIFRYLHFLEYRSTDLFDVVSPDAKKAVRCKSCRLTPRWSQRRLPLEFMDSLSYTTIIEPAEPLARRRGSALDR